MLDLGHTKLCNLCFSEVIGDRCTNCDNISNIELYTTALKEGSVLAGKYAVGRVLGKGGFGVTYLCFDLIHQKKVAIKEFLPVSIAGRSMGDATVYSIDKDNTNALKLGAEKFLSEAKTVSSFNGAQGIINVFEFFYENNTAYFVMEYLEGCDLKHYIKNKGGKISVNEALAITNQVVDALGIVHASKILHRDISPDNIFICNDGRIKLIDFGAARQMVSEATNSMSVILKHGFAPPEQYNKNGNQGPWTDIYALGATLYLALTGKLVDDVMTRLTEDTLDTKGIPRDLANIIKKMLAIKTSDRYQSTQELKMALSYVNSSALPPVINPTSPPVHISKDNGNVITEIPAFGTVNVPQKPSGSKKTPLVVLFSLMSVAVISLAVVLGIVLNRPSPAPEPSPTPTPSPEPIIITPNQPPELPDIPKKPEPQLQVKPEPQPETKPEPQPIELAIIASGSCGSNVAWKLDENYTLTISGSGEMKNYSSKDNPWGDYKDRIRNLVISEGVTTVGEHAFRRCASLETISLPNSLKVIGKGAFCFCDSLENFTIPSGVSYIGDYAFVDTPRVTAVSVALGNKYFTADSEGVLYNKAKTKLIYCPNAKTYIDVPYGVTEIGDYAFNECVYLVEVSLPNTVVRIGNAAFCACDSLETINIPASVTEIAQYAFSDSSNISSIILPESVRAVGEYAFSEWKSHQLIYICGAISGWNSKWNAGCNAQIYPY